MIFRRLFIIPSYCLILFAIVSLGIIFIRILNSNTDAKSYSLNMMLYRQDLSQNSWDRSSPRILCFILTSPQHFLTRAKAVNETWAPRCNRYFFVTEYPPNNISLPEFNFTNHVPILPLENIQSGYDHLTQKVALAFLYAYEHYFNDFDWFVKADDDTYLIVENLKLFLSQQNTCQPVTFGYTYTIYVTKGYHQGGASYVLSREALRRFYQAHQEPNTTCVKDGGAEDVEIAKCLRTQDVYPGKALDKYNRELFHPLTFAEHFSPPGWLPPIAENPVQGGYNCCSEQSISFHHIPPDLQYLMDFLLYKVRRSSEIR